MSHLRAGNIRCAIRNSKLHIVPAGFLHAPDRDAQLQRLQTMRVPRGPGAHRMRGVPKGNLFGTPPETPVSARAGIGGQNEV